MRNTYILTVPSIQGKIVLSYENQQLRLLEDKANLSRVQLEWLMAKRPFTEQELKALAQEMATEKGARLQMIPTDLSFDTFWNAYKKKVNKLRCEPLWEKLKEDERMECLMSLSAYEGFLRRDGRAKLDPENYLKRRAWENSWGSL